MGTLQPINLKSLPMQILRNLIVLTVFFALAACVEPDNVKPTRAIEQESSADTKVFVQLGHSNTVNTVAFSPDGKFALSGSERGTFILWDVSTGREIRSLQGTSAHVEGVAFSPDGQHVLYGAYDNSLELWNIYSGPLIHSFKGHNKHVGAVAFSPDGQRALSGSKDGMLKLWNVNSGREIRSFQGHERDVLSVTFSPDGQLALSGAYGQELKLWNINTGHLIRSFKYNGSSYYQGGGIRHLAFSPNGQLALSAGEGGVKLWDINTGRLIRSIKGGDAVAFSPDGQFALSGSNLWEIKTGRLIRSFQGETSRSEAVAFSPDGQLILSAHHQTLKLWDINTGREIRSFQGHANMPTAVAFLADGQLALSRSSDKTLKWWNIKNGRLKRSSQEKADWRNVVFSPDGKFALSWDQKTLKLWNINTGLLIHSFQGIPQNVTALAFSPDNQLVLSASSDYLTGKMIQLWKIKNGHLIRTFQEPNKAGNDFETIYSLTFSPDGQFALSGEDKKIKLWDINTGRLIRSFEGHVGNGVLSLAFSPDGQFALSGGTDQALRLWNIKTGRLKRLFEGHMDMVYTVAFSPDGKLALSSSADHTIRTWNVDTGQEVAQFVSFEDGEWITITPEGYYTASLNGAKYLNVRVGNQIYGIDQYEAIYHRPDIVKLALELGNSQQAIAQTTHGAPAVEFAAVQPPKIWFIAPKNGYETDHPSIEVQIKTQDIADTAEVISFTINQRPVGTEKGKRILPTAAGANVKTYTKQIPLQVGKNKIQAQVRGTAGAVQRTPPLLVVRKGVTKKLPVLYYLGIGVAQHPQLPLKYPVKDVKGLETVLKQQQGKAYQRVITKTLTNQEATRDNIINAITTFFEPVKRGDIAILFISGHGMNTKLGYHFLSYDALPDKLKTTGASWEIFNAINKLKAHVLLLADTCHAANIAGNTDWQARAKADPNQFLRQANLHNVIILASSSGAGVSHEDPNWGHGAFTKALIEGLGGKAIGYKKGVVKLSYLQDYVRERVPELTDNLQRPMIPRMTGSGEFLELVLAIK